MKFTSPPAQNARPAPVKTMTRTSGSLPASDSFAQIAPHMADERIQTLRPVERDGDDAIFFGD